MQLDRIRTGRRVALSAVAVRADRHRPDLRHWLALAELVGVYRWPPNAYHLLLVRGFDMDRSALAASILKIDGIVLLVVAAIHLSATPLVLNFVSSQSTAAGYAQIKPLFLLSFTVVGILLIPIGLSTFFCANPIRRGEPLARSICCFNAISILMLPVVLMLTMPVKYFSAIPFLTATILVSLVALSISAPLALVHSKPFSANRR